jgi:hypothetical protein
MTSYLYAGLGILSALATLAVGDLVSEEIRGWLDVLPHAILRLAALRLDPFQRAVAYEDEWLPELCYILKGSEARPISRLLIGVRFSLSLLASRSVNRVHDYHEAREVIEVAPKDPILKEAVRSISETSDLQYERPMRLAPGIRTGRYVIYMSGVPVSPTRYRELRREEVVLMVHFGVAGRIPMSWDEFGQIAGRLRQITSQFNSDTGQTVTDEGNS